MKILHVISSLEIGGAQKLLSELLPAMKRQGADVELLVYRKTGSALEARIEKAGIRILSLDVVSNYSWRIIPKLRRIFKKYDVIHAHLFPVLYQVVAASLGRCMPIYYTEHSTHNRRREKSFLRPVERFIYSRLTYIIAISAQTKSVLDKWLGWDVHNSRVIVVNNGVDVDLSLSVPTKRILPKNTILMVSRFSRSKDQGTLIRAIPLLADSHLQVAFAGDGETLDEVRRLAGDMGLLDRCLFLGSRDDVSILMYESKIGIQSSHWEGFGLTAVEFMAMGKPIVASDVDGLKQIVEGAGIIFPQGDERALAEAINKLMADAVFYESIAAKCLNRAQKFSIEVTAQEYLSVYAARLH